MITYITIQYHSSTNFEHVMVIACLVSDFDNKCRPTKLNMTKTKLKNVDRWFHFQSIKTNVNKTIAEIAEKERKRERGRERER